MACEKCNYTGELRMPAWPGMRVITCTCEMKKPNYDGERICSSCDGSGEDRIYGNGPGVQIITCRGCGGAGRV